MNLCTMVLWYYGKEVRERNSATFSEVDETQMHRNKFIMTQLGGNWRDKDKGVQYCSFA